MKKRFLGLFCGLATVTVAISLAIAAIGKTNNHFSVNREDRPSNTFVIDEDTPVISDAGDYYAVALSNNGVSINTKFIGFDKVDGKLTIKKNTRAIFLTVDPINVGFSGIAFNFANEGGADYSVSMAAYFSYFMLNLDDIAAGKYKDLVAAVQQVEQSNDLVIQLTDHDFNAIVNCRYVLGVLYASEDLTLKELSYSTYCVAQAAEVDEIGYYNDWKANEKAACITAIGEVIPFVGNGSYYPMYDSSIFGAFLTEAKQNAYKTALINAGFSHYYVVSVGDVEMIYYQKKVEDTVKTVALNLLNDDLKLYQIGVSTSLAWIDSYNDWPSEYVAENLSSSFASFVNQSKYQIKGTNATYACSAMSSPNDRTVSILVSDYTDSILELCQNAVNALSLIVSENPAYSFYTTNPTPLPVSGDITEFDYSVTDGLRRISVSYAKDIGFFSIMLMERILSATFPTEQVNNYLGLEPGSSVIPYAGAGQFSFDYGVVYVYEATKSDLDAYLVTLEANGFTASESGEYQYLVSGGVFEQYTLHISYENLASKGQFSMYFMSSSQGDSYESFNEALSNFASDHLMTEHTYPTITGDHKYKIMKYGYKEGNGIFISGLGQGYIDELLQDGVYNAYYDAYVFETEHEGDGYFAIRANLVSGGVRVEPLVVYIYSSDALLDSTDANEELRQGFMERFDYLETDEPDLYAAYLASRVLLPESNGEKIYKVDRSELSVSIYGNNRNTYSTSLKSALTTNGFAYSRFANKYSKVVDGDEYALVNTYAERTNDYGARYYQFEYRFESYYQFIDFVPYAAANLSGLEANFANFPHSGEEALFVKPNDFTVIVSDEFDNATFTENLIANGFEHPEERSYRKVVGNDLYTVYVDDMYGISPYEYYGGLGYTIYRFNVNLNYYKTFSDLVSEFALSSPSSFINALPTYGSSDIAFANGGSSPENLYIDFKDGYSLTDFKAALVSKGYTLKDGSYVYVDDNYSVYCQVRDNDGEHSITFSYKEFNWTSYPTPAANLDNIYFYLHELIPMPEESGNLFCYDDNSGSDYFNFYLKKSVNIENYIAKFVALGYKIQDQSEQGVYLHYQKDSTEIAVSISINVDCYYVRVNDYSYRTNYTANFSDIQAFLNSKGYNGVNFLSVDVTLTYERAYFYVYSEDVTIELNNVESTELDNLRTILQNDSTYTNEEWDPALFYKQTSEYRYEIYVTDYGVTIRVMKITPEP